MSGLQTALTRSIPRNPAPCPAWSTRRRGADSRAGERDVAGARAAGRGPGGRTSEEPAGGAGKRSDLAAEATSKITARRPAGTAGQRLRQAARRAQKGTAISGLAWQRDADPPPPPSAPKEPVPRRPLRPGEAGCPRDTAQGPAAPPEAQDLRGDPPGCPLLSGPPPWKKGVGPGQAGDSLQWGPSMCPHHPL